MDKMNVGGIAVRPGVSRNGIKYIPEELNKFSSTLKTRPILLDHRSDNIDNNVGIVTDSSSSLDGSVPYTGWVKDNGRGVIERLADGRLKEVSIGAICNLVEDENSDNPIAVDIEAMELSIVSCPGVVGTSISQCLEGLNNAKTHEERLKVKPIAENVNTFQALEEVQAHIEEPKEVKVKMTDEVIVKDDSKVLAEKDAEIQKLQEKVTGFEAEAAEAQREKDIAEQVEKRVQEQVTKDKELVEAEVVKEDEPTPDPVKPKEEPETKGEVADDPESDADESVDGMVIESAKQGSKGYALYRSSPKEGSRMDPNA